MPKSLCQRPRDDAAGGDDRRCGQPSQRRAQRHVDGHRHDAQTGARPASSPARRCRQPWPARRGIRYGPDGEAGGVERLLLDRIGDDCRDLAGEHKATARPIESRTAPAWPDRVVREPPPGREPGAGPAGRGEGGEPPRRPIDRHDRHREPDRLRQRLEALGIVDDDEWRQRLAAADHAFSAISPPMPAGSPIVSATGRIASEAACGGSDPDINEGRAAEVAQVAARQEIEPLAQQVLADVLAARQVARRLFAHAHHQHQQPLVDVSGSLASPTFSGVMSVRIRGATSPRRSFCGSVGGGTPSSLATRARSRSPIRSRAPARPLFLRFLLALAGAGFERQQQLDQRDLGVRRAPQPR